MNTILKKEQLSDNVYSLKISAPLIAQERRPGQFIILQVHDKGERIPLTIADADPQEGSIRLIFQVVGQTTILLSHLNVGDKILHLVGPLGHPTRIEKYGHVVCVGGGIGIAPLYPIAKAMKEIGNTVTCILGARTKDLLLLEKDIAAFADQVIICTDDGSSGRKGLVTEPLKELCEGSSRPDLVTAIGPAIMMKFCAETTRPFHIPTIVSLNTIMVDGTGMCGGCRVNVGDDVKFVCVDGPEFDGHKVNFDNMIQRLNAYKDQEQEARHKCKLDKY